VPGLGISLGRGGATTFQQDLANSDCIVIQGSNMAECHPVGFRWVMKAKERGAKIIHVDPRFTRTSAMADLHVPIRSGTDIAFLGGIINHVLQNDGWFKEYVLAYTNASALVSPDFRGPEDLDGLFSGYDPENRIYDDSSWKYQLAPVAAGEVQGIPLRDPSLQDPHCVFQILKRHYSRYTPEMVARICGCSEEQMIAVAQALIENSGRERTSAFCYAVGWTQHTVGVQYIRTCGILQLLLGNIGRPGGGILALRGHATIQGSTDIATLYHVLPGYLPAPDARKKHATLGEYLEAETKKTGYWVNMPKFMVSFLKAYYGDAATPENDFGYSWIGKIVSDHSHLPMFVAMNEGTIKGFMAVGQNPAVGGQNALYQRKGLGRLEWMVVRDLFLTETAEFWKAPGANPADVRTEVFFLPSAYGSEVEGSFTNTQRLIQWRERGGDPPGDARSDIWFTVHLGHRLKKLYASSTDPKERPIQALVWDYRLEGEEQEPAALDILREINGYNVADGSHVAGFADLKEDGSTACGGWVYSGVYPAPGKNLAANRKITPDNYVNLEWGYSWPGNRRILYNRASADPEGRPWSERKKYVWWDEAQGKWTGYDMPDFPITKPPSAKAIPGARGLDAHSGADPFIMQTDGRGWLYAPQGLRDGPLPTHYEPFETPVRNALYSQVENPACQIYALEDNPYIPVADERFPIVVTTYRLTEHHLTGVMTRWLPWLAELMPELFIEISPELAAEKGIENAGWVTITTPRGKIEAKALVTRRMTPFKLGDKIVHQVGMPWHWGYNGIARGDIVNTLAALVGDPNVSIHEGKAFQCNVFAGRKHGKEIARVRRELPKTGIIGPGPAQPQDEEGEARTGMLRRGAPAALPDYASVPQDSSAILG
jgi:formate dehydrogenase major subunit